jgi:outer membrane protein OmpA-like peptidoglycan-associated protein
MPRFGFILALLATIIFVVAARAQTQIHGFTIPTTYHNPGPTFQICTPTGSWWAGSPGYWGSYGMALCAPQTDGGPRPVELKLIIEDPFAQIEIPQKVEESLAIVEASVFFDHDSFTVGTDGIAAISYVGGWMSRIPGVRLVISGPTDATGTDGYNLGLSEKRVRAVAEFFQFVGIGPDKISMEWYGESQLLVQSPSREKLNRRVDIQPMVD